MTALYVNLFCGHSEERCSPNRASRAKLGSKASSTVKLRMLRGGKEQQTSCVPCLTLLAFVSVPAARFNTVGTVREFGPFVPTR